MKRSLLLFATTLFLALTAFAQAPADSLMPVRGISIAAPRPDRVDDFVTFMKDELAPRRVNTLVLRVDYGYAYESHPELRSDNPLTKADVKKIVAAAKEGGIRIIPQVNLLGHQSWASSLGSLLREYPEFDETPWVELPEQYEWPNPDGLYCKSYCPLHPGVHDVVFAVVDEIVEVFETDAFHAGMDEVFYIGEERCPRCSGRDRAELFAGEVTKIHDHLAERGTELWIWGDRLIDGKTTGIGMWEASMNQTYRAIDLIPKTVVINDWHYERPDPTAAYFAMKGFRVVTAPWRTPEITTEQLALMHRFRQGATRQMKDRYAGMLQTIWSSAESFMDRYYGRVEGSEDNRNNGDVESFKVLFEGINELSVAR